MHWLHQSMRSRGQGFAVKETIDRFQVFLPARAVGFASHHTRQDTKNNNASPRDGARPKPCKHRLRHQSSANNTRSTPPQHIAFSIVLADTAFRLNFSFFGALKAVLFRAPIFLPFFVAFSSFSRRSLRLPVAPPPPPSVAAPSNCPSLRTPTPLQFGWWRRRHQQRKRDVFGWHPALLWWWRRRKQLLGLNPRPHLLTQPCLRRRRRCRRRRLRQADRFGKSTRLTLMPASPPPAGRPENSARLLFLDASSHHLARSPEARSRRVAHEVSTCPKPAASSSRRRNRTPDGSESNLTRTSGL